MLEQAYRELGVDRGASEADIKSAYRKLVLQYHPDRHLNSSASEAAAAAHRFKVVTEAYDLLTNPNDRLRSSYGASSSAGAGGGSRSSRAYHYNVNTDWTHYESDGRGYTSTISRWEWWRRVARHGARSFGHSLHVSLAVLLVGGSLMFEYSHSALWAARNKGKSFEEVQAAVRARKQQAAAAAATTGGGGGDGDEGGEQQQQQVYHIRSSWADGMRGRFVDPQAGDPGGPATAADSSGAAGAAAGGAAAAAAGAGAGPGGGAGPSS